MSKIPVEKWRAESSEAMTSALWEYCPAEFVELLDAYERLLKAAREYHGRASEHFSDTTFDSDGGLSEADADLYVLLWEQDQ